MRAMGVVIRLYAGAMSLFRLCCVCCQSIRLPVHYKSTRWLVACTPSCFFCGTRLWYAVDRCGSGVHVGSMWTKREMGVIPMRSRRCDGGRNSAHATGNLKVSGKA